MTTRHGQATLQGLGAECAREVWPNTEVSIVTAVAIIDQPRSWFGEPSEGTEDVGAASLSLFVRRHFGAGSQAWRPYVEAGTGPLWAQRRVPAATSRFNFITQPGFGISFDRVVIGYRFSHISNGGYAPRNPGLNVHGIIVGASWHR